jgi:hexosaminidase
MRSIRLLIVAVLLAVLPPTAVFTSAAPAASAPTIPQTVPALRTWTARSGGFSFGAQSRVVVDPAYASQLTGDAKTFAEDLSALEGRTVCVVQGKAAAGDITLTLGGTTLPTEGYTITVGSSITIKGGTSTGEFWGTRTVLQLLHQSPTIPAGTAEDWPVKAERGLMIDTGRRFFPLDWVENQIRDMSYLKMNYLHLHLSDTFGFRLESSTHPEVTSPEHYSKQELADIIALGNAYHVTVVPEIDMPGHMDAILKGELSVGKDYRLKDSSGKASDSFIDLSIPAARTLMSDLIEEYLPLFTSSEYWHLGADEYVTDYSAFPQLLSYARANYGPNTTAKDTYYGFINWANDIVHAGGKTMRMWNDGIKPGDGTIEPASDIIVEYWTNSGLTPQQLIDVGHTVANESWTPTYYVYGGGKPDTRWMYESWNPGMFERRYSINDPSKNLGSVIHVWCDTPTAETLDQTAAGLLYPMRDLAQMTWGPRPVSTYAAFVPIMDAIGRNPLWPGTGEPSGAINGVGSGRCIDIPGADNADETQLQLYDCNGTPAQIWSRPSDGTIRAMGKCMDVRGATTADGTEVQLNSCDRTSSAQQWTYDPATSELKALGRCLDAYGAGTANGTKLILYTCQGRSNQQWKMPS